ncbi:cytochrome b561 and DOMON domain-containing protein At2g04850-like [Selaginella moellendorffii]|uniref:cytochrome b561 and DOMON domain-containing protein At2g04850-like n=1 Tax=Selaginella moellendorffii TaxID=88036 RepID=UPI000D1C2544|nr:cytochrome b561 and DOMON domain-containing protein At2g04850-like [Selaginella moellendorffii]|eukprot:XP_024538314.1 cytochrome b561 and DOMON domain-containing protein At2g04850-like [Selaginella moellendorffii]
MIQLLNSVIPILVFFTTPALGACTASILLNGNTRTYSSCSSLNSWSQLSWTFDPSARTMDTMFRALLTSPSGWVGWGINSGSTAAMLGSNVLLGFTDSSNVIRVAQYSLTPQILRGTLPSPASSTELRLVGSSFIDISSGVVTIFAKLSLPTNQSISRINLVFCRGPGTRNLSPLPHTTDASFLRQTTAVLDMSSNRILRAQAPHQSLKLQHGIINAVGWGIFLPLGVMVARYVRPYSHRREWFFGHVGLQCTGYLLGVVGWGIGLKLASYSGESAASQVHQNVGTAIFVFATLQVLSLVFRPEKEHKIRPYWKIYHHGLGYLTLVLIFTNIYKGFKLLQGSRTLKNLYTAFLVIAVLATAGLEAYRWYVYLEKKSKRPAYASESPTSDSKI